MLTYVLSDCLEGHSEHWFETQVPVTSSHIIKPSVFRDIYWTYQKVFVICQMLFLRLRLKLPSVRFKISIKNRPERKRCGYIYIISTSVVNFVTCKIT